MRKKQKRRDTYNRSLQIKLDARSFISNAVRDGKIIRPKICPNCKMHSIVQAHHPDHLKVNEVVWLCIYCHRKLEYGHKIEGKLIVYAL